MTGASVPVPEVPRLLIRPSRGWSSLGLREIWAYRELLYFLIWRDVKIRYKQTVLGAAWAILQPLLTMVVFTIFFGGLAKVGSDGLPYPIFSFAGLLPWTFFAQGLGQSSGSIVGSSEPDHEGLLSPARHPDLVGSRGLGGLRRRVRRADRDDGLLRNLADVSPCSGFRSFFCLPPGPLWASVSGSRPLSVEYRDVRFVVPFFVQLWLFVTPVIYPASKVVAKLAELGLPTWLYGLNPMAGVVEGFRWALLGTGSLHVPVLVASALMASLLLVVRCLLLPANGEGVCRCQSDRRNTGSTGQRQPSLGSGSSAAESSPARVASGGGVSDLSVSVRGLSKQFRIGEWEAPYKTLRESLVTLATPRFGSFGEGRAGHARSRRRSGRCRDVSFEVRAGRGDRHHRPQRRRQEHAAEDPLPHHRADGRARSRSTAA